MYQSVFRIKLLKEGVNEVIIGKFVDSKASPSRLLQGTTEFELLNFNQSVIEHSSTELIIRINFADKSKISSGKVKDRIEVDIL